KVHRRGERPRRQLITRPSINGVQHPLQWQSHWSLPAQSLATLGPTIGSTTQLMGLKRPAQQQSCRSLPPDLRFARSLPSAEAAPSTSEAGRSLPPHARLRSPRRWFSTSSSGKATGASPLGASLRSVLLSVQQRN